jgi:hypothetical protein
VPIVVTVWLSPRIWANVSANSELPATNTWCGYTLYQVYNAQS